MENKYGMPEEKLEEIRKKDNTCVSYDKKISYRRNRHRNTLTTKLVR